MRATTGAATGLAGCATDPLNIAGEFSDGDDGRLPAVACRRAGRRVSHAVVALRRDPPELHAHRAAPHRSPRSSRSSIAAAIRPARIRAERARRWGSPTSEQADLVAFLAALDGPGPDAALLVAP